MMTDLFGENANEPAGTPPGAAGKGPMVPEPQRYSAGTYIVLTFMLLVFPAFNLLVVLLGGNDIDISGLDIVWMFYVPTLIMLWLFVLAVGLALWRERASLATIGLGAVRMRYFIQAILFIIASNIILFILQKLMMLLGLNIHDNVAEIVQQSQGMYGWWFAISISAAFCEEITFRGYIMTRVKQITGRSWLIPVLVSTVAFASGHLYQGTAGFILIFIYGAMFSLLYIRTGSIWPGIFAHFIQDFTALWFAKYMDF